MDVMSPEILSRKNNVPQTLSKFIERFHQENNLYLKAVDLSYFFAKHLEKISSGEKESERELFFKFASNIPDLFDDVSRYDNNTGNEECEKKAKLECYSFLVDSMMQSLKLAVTIPEILIMLQPSLILLHKGFDHCKECETIYEDLLQQFKDLLAALFNKMRDFLEIVELKFSKIMDRRLHSEQLKPIILNLNKLCELVFILDSPRGIGLYKTLIKLFEAYEELGYTDLQIDSILTGLFLEIINIGDEFKLAIKKEEQVSVQENQMFLFKLNVVKKIIKMFPSFIKENLQSIINFILHLYELLISCYYKLPEEEDAKCLKNILVENISSVLPLFYAEKTFLTSVLLLTSKEISSGLLMAHLLLKLSALNFLVASKNDDILPERKDVIENIFLMLCESTPRDDMILVSLKLPLSLFRQSKNLLGFHQSQSESEPKSVTLYYHAYLHLSEYCKNISDSELQNLESFVVDFLLRNSSAPALLISDVWIYRLRYGTPENLFARCVSFSAKLSDMTSNGVAKLILKRMIKFLPLTHKKRLFDQDEQLKALCNQDRLHRYGAPESSKPSKANKRIVSNIVSALLVEVKKRDLMNNEQLREKACCVLKLCALSIDAFKIQEFLRITELATLLFKSEIYEVQIAVLTFLRSLNLKKFTDNDPMFAKVRAILAVLYNEALRSKNYIVRLEALSLFKTMAELTEIRITQETIAKFPHLFPAIKAYFSEVPESGFMKPQDRNELLEKLVSIYKNKRVTSSNLSDQSKSVLSLLQPA